MAQNLCTWLEIISETDSNASDTNCGILPELHMGWLPWCTIMMD